MKVTGYGIIKPASGARKRDGASAANFSDFLSAAEAGEAHASSLSDVAATANLSGLFALQEISEEEKRREHTLKRGKNMLDSLERLRQQLLMGEIPGHMLTELSAQLAQQKQDFKEKKPRGIRI